MNDSVESENKQVDWTVGLAGISKVTGYFIQISRTVKNGTMADAVHGLQEIQDLFEARQVSPINASFVNGLAAGHSTETPNGNVPVHNGETCDIRTVKISSMRLMFTPNGNAHLICKAAPGLMKHGVPAWSEVFEPLIGASEDVMRKYGIAKDIPIPEAMQFGWVEYKDGKPQKIISFTPSPQRV